MRFPSTLAPICLLGFILVVNAFSWTAASLYGNTSNSSLPVNTSSNASLLPPYYRNGTTGTAWIPPASSLDLGARAMICECFDPDGTFLP